MNIELTHCNKPDCTNKLDLVYSQKYKKYMAYPCCYWCIDPFEKEFDRLELHKFHKDMPEMFRETDLALLPNERIKDALVNMPKGNYSYLFHGTTGAGKSRAAWWITDKFFRRNYPVSFEFVNPRRLDSLLIGSFEQGVGAHDKAVELLCKTPLLVIDDLGKERITPRMETDLFSILDERVSNRKHTIVTTNFNSQGLCDRFPTSETGMAFIRRMKENLTAIGTGMI